MQSQSDIQPSLEIPSDSNEVPLQKGDVELHFCNTFSIRYYAFASRQMDIVKNWPFSRECLQVCLKHGIKNLLPPFESPGLVRHKSCNEDIDSDSTEEKKSRADTYQNYSAESNVAEESIKFTDDLYIEEEVSGVSKQVGLLSLSRANKNIEKDENTSEMASKFDSGSFKNSAGEVLETPPLVLATEDRCDLPDRLSGLIVKGTVQGCNVANQNSFSENKLKTKQIRDNINSCVTSDPMSYVKRQRNKFKKHKRKGRKKRSMVDICAEARPCTLEELDKINGSNWAMDLSVRPYGNLSRHEGFVSEGNGQRVDLDLSDTKPQVLPDLETCNCKSKLVDGFLHRKHQNRKLSSCKMKETKIPSISSARSQSDSAVKVKSNSQPVIQDQEREVFSSPDNLRPIACFPGKNSKKCINRKRGSRHLEIMKEQAIDAKCSNGSTAKSDNPSNDFKEGLPQISFVGGVKLKQRRLLETKSPLHFKTTVGSLVDGFDSKSLSHTDSLISDSKQSNYSEAHMRGLACQTISSTGFKGRGRGKQKKLNMGPNVSDIISPKIQNGAQEIPGIDSYAVSGGAVTRTKHFKERTQKFQADFSASTLVNSVSKSGRSPWCPSVDKLSCGKSMIRYEPRCTRSVTLEKQVSSRKPSIGPSVLADH